MERSARRRAAASSREASQAAARLGGDIDEALAEVGVPALLLDRGGVVRWQNARADEILGDRRGLPFSSFVAPESIHETRAEFAKQVIGTARTSRRKIVLHGVEGVRFPVEVNTVSLGDGREVVGVFGIAHTAEPAPAAPAPLRQGLTPRQHQVLLELARGASTEQIAASLGVARDTVRNHVRGILRSLGVHSRLEAVAEARRRGLLGQ